MMSFDRFLCSLLPKIYSVESYLLFINWKLVMTLFWPEILRFPFIFFQELFFSVSEAFVDLKLNDGLYISAFLVSEKDTWFHPWSFHDNICLLILQLFHIPIYLWLFIPYNGFKNFHNMCSSIPISGIFLMNTSLWSLLWICIYFWSIIAFKLGSCSERCINRNK